jgi:hypothetical protein
VAADVCDNGRRWTKAAISDTVLQGGGLKFSAEEESTMVKRLMFCTAALLFVGGMALAGQDMAKKGTWSGVITNDMCGAKDASAAKADCTKTCVKEHGAKYALYNPADKKVYVLDPQDKAAGHEGHNVTVTGTVDGSTIHVDTLTMAKGN